MGFERNRGTTGAKPPMEAPVEGEKKGDKPDYRVVQATTDKEGKSEFTSVGAIWLNKNPDGKVAANLKIGQLRLLVFENKDKE